MSRAAEERANAIKASGPSPEQIPGEEAVEAAYQSLAREQLKWLASPPPGRKTIARTALQDALPALFSQWREGLLSEEAVEAACKRAWPLWIAMTPGQKDGARRRTRRNFKSALDHLEQGTDQEGES